MDEKRSEKITKVLSSSKDKIEKVNISKNAKAKWILGLIGRVRENEPNAKRSLAKTLTWRILATSDTFFKLVNYWQV